MGDLKGKGEIYMITSPNGKKYARVASRVRLRSHYFILTILT